MWSPVMGKAFSGSIHVASCISTPFLLGADQYSIAWICCGCLSVHQLVHPGCFCSWPLMSNAAMDVHGQVYALMDIHLGVGLVVVVTLGLAL